VNVYYIDRTTLNLNVLSSLSLLSYISYLFNFFILAISCIICSLWQQTTGGGRLPAPIGIHRHLSHVLALCRGPSLTRWVAGRCHAKQEWFMWSCSL